MEENKDKYKFRYYFVRSMACAGYCMMHKFILHSLEPDRDFPRRNVFKFTNSQALRDCIEKYKLLDK